MKFNNYKIILKTQDINSNNLFDLIINAKDFIGNKIIILKNQSNFSDFNSEKVKNYLENV